MELWPFGGREMYKAVPTDPAEDEEHTMAIFSLFTVQSWAAGRAPEHP